MFLLIAVVRVYLRLLMAYDMPRYISCLRLCLCHLKWNSPWVRNQLFFYPDFINFLNWCKHHCKTMIISYDRVANVEISRYMLI